MREYPHRLVVEGEELVVHRFPTGSFGLASLAELVSHEIALKAGSQIRWWQRLKYCLQKHRPHVKVAAVWVPHGAYLILKSIPRSMQQRYGLEEQEGGVFTHSAGVDCAREGVRFHDGVELRLQDLQEGQTVEVLSLAGSRIALYEIEFQVR